MEYKFDNEELIAFRDLSNEQKKLLVNAYIDGAEIEYQLPSGKWCHRVQNSTMAFYEGVVYRIKPKPTKKLDIPWKYINPKYEWAAMDKDGVVYFYVHRPKISRNCYYDDTAESISFHDEILIRKEDVEWQTSLTKRPD